MSCPKCGGRWTKKPGLLVCEKCSHRYGSQNPSELTSNYGQVINPSRALMFGSMPFDPVDDEEPIQFIHGRARELKFGDDE